MQRFQGHPGFSPQDLDPASEVHLHALLQFEIDEDELGTIIRQTAVFDPVGLFGLVYWYALFPVHSLVFAGMLRGIVRELGIEHER